MRRIRCWLKYRSCSLKGFWYDLLVLFGIRKDNFFSILLWLNKEGRKFKKIVAEWDKNKEVRSDEN